MGRKEELLQQLRELEIEQYNCKHQWGEPFENNYQQEEKELVMVVQGSDIWSEYKGTGFYKTVKRWTRVCKLCGKEEHTETLKNEIILSIKKPNFGD